jgi:UDP-N-acetylglucosamine:LPS N-acetylglucosamine transferase
MQGLTRISSAQVHSCASVRCVEARAREFLRSGYLHLDESLINVDSYMSISDFFIGKPGPGSVSEALHFNLPVIVERNGKTLPQERYNTDWIRENEVGIVLKNFGEIESALCDLLSNGRLERFQVNAAATKIAPSSKPLIF